ncbi:MAG: thermonuclease family protein [Thiotrichales bacterium]
MRQRLTAFWLIALIGIAAPWVWRAFAPPASAYATPTRGDTRTCTVASVHDGDTMRVRCNGESRQVRLYCIDAPELGQRPWGQESRDALRAMAPQGATVEVRVRDKDRYGRFVGEVFRDGENLNQRQVERGHSVVYDAFCPRVNVSYYRAESRSKIERLGVWAQEGPHQQPWRWRH